MQQNHGGNIWACSKRLAVAPDDIIDFSASINQFGGFSLSHEDLVQLETTIRHYPDPDYLSLRKKIGSFHGVGVENILPGNGSIELLYLLPKALKPTKVFLPLPSFSEYERALLIENIDIEFLFSSPEEGFRVPLDHLVDKVEPGSMIILGNPNSPTGTFLRKRALKELIEVCEKREAWLCVDEAFIDFVSESQHETLVRESVLKNYLIVVRSFTKFFSVPGLRIGYVVGGSENIRKIQGVQPPWGINAISEFAVFSILDEVDGISRKTLASLREEQDYIRAYFKGLPSLKLYPSEVNFFLVEILNRNLDAKMLCLRLLEYGIMIRDCASFRGLDGRFFRFAVRNRQDNSLLLEKLKEITG